MSVLGTLFTDFKKAGGAVKSFFANLEAKAPAIIKVVAQDEAMIAPVLEAFIPGSAKAMQVSDNVINHVAQAIEDAGAAAGANGLSVQLDQATVQDVKDVIAAAKSWSTGVPATGALPVGPAPAVPKVG